MRTEKTEAYKRKMQIGADLADALPQLMTQKEVGARLGISAQAVGQIERRALAKVREKLLEHAANLHP